MNWLEVITLALVISLHADGSRVAADRWEKKGRLGWSAFVLLGGIIERLISMGVFGYGIYLFYYAS